MAIIKEARSSRLQIIVQIGVDETGKPVLRTRSFSGVQIAATDEAVHAAAQALAGLQQYPVHSIVREDDSELIEQP